MPVAHSPIARGPLRGVSRHGATMTLGCLAALGAILTASSMAGRYTGVFYGARVLSATVAYVVLAVVAYVRPQVPGRRGPSIMAALLTVAMAVLFAVRGLAGGDVAGACGTVCYAAVYAWMTYLLTCLLVRLPTLKLVAVAVVGGTLLRQLLLPVYSLPLSPVAGAAVLGLVCLGTVAGLAAAGAPFMSTLRSGESLEVLQLTNPLSALRPPNRLFFAVLLVSVTYNFSNALGVPGLSARRMVVVFVLLGVLYLLLVQRAGQEDRLFSLSVLCIMVGLLLAPLFLGRDAFAAHTFLFLGSTCFDILIWLLIYSVGRRSVAAVLPVFAATFALQMFGRFAGANLGRVAFSTVAQDPRGTQAVILILAIVFSSCLSGRCSKALASRRPSKGWRRWTRSRRAWWGNRSPRCRRGTEAPVERPRPWTSRVSTSAAASWERRLVLPRASRRSWNFWPAAVTPASSWRSLP